MAACLRVSVTLGALFVCACTAKAEVNEQLSIVARFKDIADEVAQQAKDLSLNDAMALRSYVRELSMAIDAHHASKLTLRNFSRSGGAARHPLIPYEPRECRVFPDPHPGKSNIPIGHRERIAAQHNIPLAYFEAGYYGNVSSADPRVFGPDAWRTLHRFSVHYPASPATPTQAACENFVRGLPYMIPCAHCGHHLQEFVVLNEKHSGEVREECLGNCTSVATMCQSRSMLVGFFARAHNNVNIHNYKSRANFTIEDVYSIYMHASTWTTQGPVDGKCQLIWSSTEEHYSPGYPDYWQSGDADDVMQNMELCAQASSDSADAHDDKPPKLIRV